MVDWERDGGLEALRALTEAIKNVVAERAISNYEAQRLLHQIADEVQRTFMPCWYCRKVHSGQRPCERSVIETRFKGAR